MVSSNHVFSGFAFIGFVLVSILLPLHIKARNVGTCAFIIWTGLLCLNGFVNSVIWDDNVTNWAPVWCDISTRLIIGGNIGVPSACLCIARHIYLVTSNIAANRQDYRGSRRRIMCDYLLVVGIPILEIILSYIVQIFRFIIYEEIGPYPALLNTQLTYSLILFWPVVVTLAIAVYVGLTVHRLMRRRAHMKGFAQSDEQRFSVIALVATLSLLFICSFAPAICGIVVNISVETVFSWPGLDSIHADISKVLQITTASWKASGTVIIADMQFQRWIFVAYAIIFFGFFGFTPGAKKDYRLVFNFITGRPHRNLEISEDQMARNEHFSGHRRPTLLTIISQVSDPHYFSLQSPTLSAGSLHGTLRESRPAESSELNVVEPVQPVPVLDIVSILRRHSSDSNVGFGNSLPSSVVP